MYLSRRILWDMAVVQFKAKYAGSKLGIWWAVITPLILAVSINFVFNTVFKIEIPNYTLFVLAGMIPWIFFSNAVMEAANSLNVNSAILNQSTIPAEFIPLSSVLANLLNFLIGLLFLLPLFIILNFKTVGFLLFLFIIITFHFVFIIGLGFLFSSINFLFKDLSHFLSIAFMIWFWITPVFYSLEMMPFSFRWICLFNPMTYYIVLYQNVLFYLKIPSLISILGIFLIAIVSVSMGYIFFFKNESSLLKRI